MAGLVLAIGSAMQATNPVSGYLERVWEVHDGHDYEIHWAKKVGTVWTSERSLTDNTADDTNPRLAFFADGSTAVAWKRAGSSGGRIYYLGHDYTDGWQSSAVAVSDGTRDASMPAALVFGSNAWIAWQEQATGGMRVMAGGSDGGDAWPLGFTVSHIGTSSLNAPYAEISKSGTHLWVSWIDSSTQLGWSEYDSTNDTWSTEQHESYSGPADIPAARARIETTVTQ